jgi:GNAT superfamily N-acetyltransferase
MIKIKQLNKKLLLEYINSIHFGEGNDIPVTYHRALSHINNPRLEDDDVILLLAYDNGNMVGYLGIMPDYIFLENKSPIKVGWLSSLWVSHSMRGTGLGVRLITKSLELWNNYALLADYVPFTKKLYDRTKLFIDKPYSKKGIRLYIKSDLVTLLPPKNIFFAKLKLLLKATDICANVFLNIRLMFLKAGVSDLFFEYIDHIDDEVNEFIRSKQEKQVFKRKKEELNWIINNPWILSAGQKDDLNKKYYFSSTAKSFKFHSLKVRNSNNELIGFMIFTEKDNTLKLPYLYHDNCLDSIIQVINYNILKWKIRTFTTFNMELGQRLMNTKSPAILKREVKRNYMISSVLRAAINNSDIEIQDGDGDCAFT